MALSKTRRVLYANPQKDLPQQRGYTQFHSDPESLKTIVIFDGMSYADMGFPSVVTVTVEPGDTLNNETEPDMASKKTHPAVKNARKIHLERPEEGKRGKTMCGAKTDPEKIADTKKKVTCGNCSKVLTGSGTWYTATKRKRTLAEKKQKGA